MQFNDQARLDPSQMSSGGGFASGTGGKIAVGGIGGVLILILSLVFGVNPGDLTDTTAPASTSAANPYAQCTTGASIQTDQNCRFVAYTNSIQAYWKTQLQGYQNTQTVTYSGVLDTPCGQASNSVGPFFCPTDDKIYLDTSFFQTLTKQLGAQGGYAAEAYVIAHEYGHYLSKQIGTMQQAQADRSTGPASGSVKLELQADCFAGSWLANATADPNSPIASLTQDDINRAVDAAISVGDDRIQQNATGRVDREAWTHGSSAMRKFWLAKGYNTGDPSNCDTFAAGAVKG